jgi:hypothetical protein
MFCTTLSDPFENDVSARVVEPYVRVHDVTAGGCNRVGKRMCKVCIQPRRPQPYICLGWVRGG